MNLDEDTARPRDRIRHVDRAQHFRSPEPIETNGFHPETPVPPAGPAPIATVGMSIRVVRGPGARRRSR